jgi:hypothetical protein
MKYITLVMMLLFSTAAYAVDGTLVGLGGSDVVFVWKDEDAQDEALSLISAGVHKTNPALLLSLIACVVPTGTSAITTDAGFVTHDILVTSGESSGCRGNVPVEAFDMH